MDDRGGPSLKRWRWVGWVVSLLALAFVVRWLARIDGTVWRSLGHLNLWWLALSLGFFLLWFLLRFRVWEFIIHRHGYEHGRGQNLRMWTTTELLRYIPGNVWSFAGRYRGARSGGVERGSTFQAIGLEAGGLVYGAALVSVMTIDSPLRWLGPISFVFLIAYGPRLIKKFLHLVKQETVLISRLESLIIILGYVGVWLIFGLAHAALFQAMRSTLGSTGLWVAMSVSVFSWLIGYITLITPMGLGIREATLAKSLSTIGHVSIATAGLAALVSRLWMVISELIFLGLVMIFSHRRA